MKRYQTIIMIVGILFVLASLCVHIYMNSLPFAIGGKTITMSEVQGMLQSQHDQLNLVDTVLISSGAGLILGAILMHFFDKCDKL